MADLETIEEIESKEKSLTADDLKDYQMNFSGEYIKKNYPEHISTGFEGLDKLLGGGLSPCLTVFGAISSLGKSTFALQMAQNISKNGTPVLYFSLEMSKHAVSMKSIQRSAFKKCKDKHKKLYIERDGIRCLDEDVYKRLKSKCVTNYDLLNDNSEKEELKDFAIAECAEECKNLYIIERDFSRSDFSAQNIADFVSRFVAVTKKKPVIFVDYLQILISSADKTHKTEKQIVDENIQKLWLIANRNKLPVFVISSVNRDSYNKSISFSSFKESGGIEFTADIVLGMQFSALHGRKAEERSSFNPDEEKGKDPRRVEILVLKQRYGKSGSNAYDRFIYYPEFSCFEEGDIKPYEVLAEKLVEETAAKKSTKTKSRVKKSI